MFYQIDDFTLEKSNDIFNCPYLKQDSKFRIKCVTIKKSGTKVTQTPNYSDY